MKPSDVNAIPAWWVCAGAVVAAIGFNFDSDLSAHKGLVSPYTYEEHVLPIVRSRCGSCHFEGGPAPMSLLTYDEALPWSEAIREQLIAETMPRWFPDPAGPPIKGGHSIGPRELDVLLTWIAGGTPRGAIADAPAVPPPARAWSLGKPDIAIALPADAQFENGDRTNRVFIVSTGLTAARWVAAVDLLPGAEARLRNALIEVESGPLLAVWTPGQNAIRAPAGTAFRVPARSRLRVTLLYASSAPSGAIRDASAVGLYFGTPQPSPRPIESAAFKTTFVGRPEERHRFPVAVPTGMRVLAIRPRLDRDYDSLAVHAVWPDGTARPLLMLRAPRADWLMRYWLVDPLELPAGSSIEVSGVGPRDPLERSSRAPAQRLQIAIDYVAK